MPISASTGIQPMFTATLKTSWANGKTSDSSLPHLNVCRFKRTGKRDQIFLATKIGSVFRDGAIGVDGSPEYVRGAIESSLKRLGVAQIDLLYLHRADVKTPIEASVRVMAEFVK